MDKDIFVQAVLDSYEDNYTPASLEEKAAVLSALILALNNELIMVRERM
jgi:hypothetical protein